MAAKFKVRSIYAPEYLILYIEALFPGDDDKSKVEKSLAYKLLSRIMNRRAKKGAQIEEYLDFPREYIRRVLDERWYYIFTKLVECGILEKEVFYTWQGRPVTYRTGQTMTVKGRTQTKPSQAQRIRINPAFMAGSIVKVTYQYRPRQKRKLKNDDGTLKPTSFEDINTLRILEALKLELPTTPEEFTREFIESENIYESVKDRINVRPDKIKAKKFKVISWLDGKILKEDTKEAHLEAAKLAGCKIIEYRPKETGKKKQSVFYSLPFRYNILNFVAEKVKHDYQITYLNQLERFSKDGKHICGRNENNTRLDNSITNLNGKFLKYLKIDGQNFGSCDLKNSQFTLLTYLLKQAFEENILKINKNSKREASRKPGIIKIKKERRYEILSKWINKYIRNKIKEKGIIKDIVSCVDNLNQSAENQAFRVVKMAEIIPADLAEFFEISTKGTFYETIAAKLAGCKIEDVTPAQRKATKDLLFQIVFDNRLVFDATKRANKERLEKIFPSLVEIIDGFKLEAEKVMFAQERKELGAKDFKLKHGNNAVKMGSNQLAILLQRVEAIIFVDVILVGLYRNHFRVLSKHDSIVCKIGDIEKVRAKVEGYLDGILGTGQYTLALEYHNETETAPAPPPGPVEAPRQMEVFKKEAIEQETGRTRDLETKKSNIENLKLKTMKTANEINLSKPIHQAPPPRPVEAPLHDFSTLVKEFYLKENPRAIWCDICERAAPVLKINVLKLLQAKDRQMKIEPRSYSDAELYQFFKVTYQKTSKFWKSAHLDAISKNFHYVYHAAHHKEDEGPRIADLLKTYRK